MSRRRTPSHAPGRVRHGTARAALLCLLSALSSLALACDGAQPGDPTTAPASATARFIDHFEDTGLSGQSDRRLPEPIVFEVGDAKRPADLGATAGPGISKLKVKDGELRGRTSDAVPVLLLRRRFDPTDHPVGDTLVRIELRMRASAGKKLWVGFDEAGSVDLERQREAAEDQDWQMTGELEADGELHSYTLSSLFAPIPAVATQNILIRPSDQTAAEFGIESLRLVFASEELAGVESGIGWHGLGEIYRESLAQRAGERIQLSLPIPARPVLNLSIGTPNDAAVRFRARVFQDGTTPGDGELIVDRSVTAPNRWESLRIALDRFAGKTVTLVLDVASDQPEAIGYWGAAGVRTREPAAAARVEDDAKAPKGVILFVADTLRKDHLNAYAYGRSTAPQLAALAKEGALFRDAVSQATWTKVSTPSLLTGLHPSTHGVLDFPDRLPATAETLAESFREAGYATLSLSSIVFSGRFSNLHQGFETLHEMGSFSEPDSSKTAREYVDRALDWLERHRDQPFFIFLHVFDPHDPYEPRPPYDQLWAEPGRTARMERAREDVTPLISDPVRRQFFMPNRAELLEAGYDPAAFATDQRDGYDGSIRGMDTEMGRVIERLRELDLERDTLFVFTSDHGEEFLDHGGSFHGQSVYGELSGVPLIMWQPGAIPPGTVVEQTVQSIDIAPTILSLSQLPIPEIVQGQSLEPLLRGRGHWTPRPAVTIKPVTTHDMSPGPRDTADFALIHDGWKLVDHVQRVTPGPRYELFNHGEDPLDGRDLASEFPETVERLAGLLEEWQQSVEATQLPSDADESDGLSEAELDRLRALGYAE